MSDAVSNGLLYRWVHVRARTELFYDASPGSIALRVSQILIMFDNGDPLLMANYRPKIENNKIVLIRPYLVKLSKPPPNIFRF